MTFLPFTSSLTPVLFYLTSAAPQVMLWFTQVSLPFPFAKKSYLVFTCGLTAEPLGVLTFFSLSSPALTQRPSHTCRHLCFCPASCLSQNPAPPSLVGSSRHLCLWVCQHTPLFHSTIQLGPDNCRKRRFISILLNTS